MFAERNVLGIEIGARGALRATPEDCLSWRPAHLCLGLTGSLPSTYLSIMLRKLDYLPCIPTAAPKVPASRDWLHEIKYDGYRMLVVRDGTRVRLLTRNGHDWTDRFPWIAESALKNRQKQFVIDGDAVILGVDGRSDFNALHSGKHNEQVQLYAFRHACRRRRRHAAASALDAQGQFGAAPGPSHRGHFHRPIRTRRDRPGPVSGGLQHGFGGFGVEAPRSALSWRSLFALGQGEEPQQPGNEAGSRSRLVAVMQRPQKITFAEMRASGVRGLC
jgi:ATP dependent DNA ligase domain